MFSCNQCKAKFPTVPDVEFHIAHYCMEQSERETRFVSENTKERQDEDIEGTFAKDESSKECFEDEVDDKNHNFQEEIRILREAPIRLSQKIRPSQKQYRIKFWPQLAEEAKKVSTSFSSRNKAREKTEKVKSGLRRFALWSNVLRAVEGKFGSGVFNYFKFLKWSMSLNFFLTVLVLAFVVLPGILLDNDISMNDIQTTCNVNSTPPNISGVANDSLWFPKNQIAECCSEQYKKQQKILRSLGWPPSNASQFFTILKTVSLNMLMGDGWMEDTLLYYGAYREDNIGHYQTPIAYFFAIFSCIAFSLLQIVRSSAQAFRKNFKWSQFNSTQYFQLVFCSWDFNIDTKESVHIKQLGLVNEMMTALNTDTIQTQKRRMTGFQRALLTVKRVVAWLIVLGVYVGFAFLIVKVYQYVQNETKDKNCPAYDNIWKGDNKVDAFTCNISPYLLTFFITSMNLVLPFFFFFIIQYEKYDPKTRLIVDIGRSIFLREMSLLVTIITLIIANDCKYMVSEEESIQACSNMGIQSENAKCQKKMCWEKSVGIEFYKLTLLDMIIQVAMVILVDIPRTRIPCVPKVFSEIEFNIPKHVLDIVYSQTICWMGLFFAPLLSLITFIKMFVIFYLRLGYLNFICKPSPSLYEASKMSSIMKMFLLISFCCALCPLTYIIAQMEPSNACGPFRNINRDSPSFYSGVVETMIEDWVSEEGQHFLYFFGRLDVMMFLTCVMSLATYLVYAVDTALKAYNSRIEQELKKVDEETRRLRANIDRALGRDSKLHW